MGRAQGLRSWGLFHLRRWAAAGPARFPTGTARRPRRGSNRQSPTSRSARRRRDCDRHGRGRTDSYAPGHRSPLRYNLFTVQGLFSVPASGMQPTWCSHRIGDQGCSRHAASSQAVSHFRRVDHSARRGYGIDGPSPAFLRKSPISLCVATQRECTGRPSGNQASSRDVATCASGQTAVSSPHMRPQWAATGEVAYALTRRRAAVPVPQAAGAARLLAEAPAAGLRAAAAPAHREAAAALLREGAAGLRAAAAAVRQGQQGR